jgi:hypothetical protein
MSYFDPNGLYRITSANRTQSLQVNGDWNSPKNDTNAVFQQAWTTGSIPTAVYTMGPMAKSDAAQLWTFRPLDNGYWTIHNWSNNQPKQNMDYQNLCIQRNESTLQLAKRKPKETRQQWYIQSTDDGEGKWVIQTDVKVTLGLSAQKFDVKKGTNQVLVTNGLQDEARQAFKGESTYWEIEYVKPAVPIASKL